MLGDESRALGPKCELEWKNGCQGSVFGAGIYMGHVDTCGPRCFICSAVPPSCLSVR